MQILSLLIAAIGGGMVFRAYSYMHGQEAFAAQVYYSSFDHFDEPLPGFAITMHINFHTGLCDSLMRHGQAMLVIGLLVTCGILYCIRRTDYNKRLIVNSLCFSVLAIDFAVLTLAALSPNS